MNPFYFLVDIARFFEEEVDMYHYRTAPKDYLKNPIILIPGVGSKWGGLKHLADFISEKGYPLYVVQELGDNLYDLDYSSKIVRKLIEENDLKNAIIVGHSKGGLIGKYLMVHDDLQHRVLGMVSLATPYSGSKLANFLLIHRWKQFGTGDKGILDLQKHTEVNKKIISISPSFDTLVWNKNKSNLEEAFENIEVSAKGHLNMTYDQQVKEKVLGSIEKISKLG